jgi:thioredoxin 1
MAIVYANDQDFNEKISSGLVLVDFYADWCGPCKMIAPVLEELSKEMDTVSIVKLDVDANPASAQSFGVMSIPTLILFKDGEPVKATMGFQPKPQLKAWIESAE